MVFEPRRCACALIVLSLALFACGGDDETPCEPTSCDGVCVAGECVADDGGVFVALEDTQPDLPSVSDVEPDEGGGFQSPCERNSDCESGYCVDTADGRACSAFCTDDCPDPDWTCRTVENSGGDVVSICLPDATVLCRPCQSDSECGGLADLCLTLGDGEFCGRECNGVDDCPNGYQCDEFSSQGELVRQCAPLLGFCGDCVDQDDDGHGEGDGCIGRDCDDLDPRTFDGAPEICDGWDNDCDDDIDEGIDFAGDEANCGACGVVCDPDAATGECVEGACVIVSCGDGNWDIDGEAENGCEYACEVVGDEVCDGNDEDCDGIVDEGVELLTDPLNCGECGEVCAFDGAAALCIGGECAIGECEEGLANCNGFSEDGCEVVLGTDVEHCGGCELACGFDNAGASCEEGACVIGDCEDGFANCNGEFDDGCEVELATALLHCGECENICAFETTGAACEAGECVPTGCGPGRLDCDEDLVLNGCEVDSTSDPAHCGRCGSACAFANAAATCESSACVMGACEGDFADCRGGAGDGCETDTGNDVDNCGACGRRCSFDNAAASCVDGACVMGECAAGWADCVNGDTDGCETRIDTDVDNCGGCGAVCEFTGAAGICSDGECSIGACEADRADCNSDPGDGCERNLTTDPLHCGSCFAACDDTNASVSCEDRVCVIDECDDGFADCNGGTHDGCEVNLETDAVHCGECRNVCVASGGTAECDEGACAIAGCHDGFGDCDGRYDTGCEVPLAATLGHCGECFSACSYDNGFAACRFGECTFLACETGFGDCNDDVELDGCETDLDTTLSDCGVCGLACDISGADEACVDGVCEFVACEENRAGCVDGPENGCETNLRTDPDHCGGCDISCDIPFTVTECAGGSCGSLGCVDGYADCELGDDGCETHTDTDAANCGGCDTVCSVPNATTGCADGLCFITGCVGGYTDGDGEYDSGCEVPPDGGPDRSGVFSLSPAPAYSCTEIIFGSTVMSINEPTFTFSFDASLSVALSRAVMTQTPAPAGDTFLVTGILPGDCQETYTLSGTFSDDDTWNGIFRLQFSGATCAFTTCFTQSWSVTGTRVP